MRNCLFLVFATLLTACGESSTSPDLRSGRAPEGTGKPVYTIYNVAFDRKLVAFNVEYGPTVTLEFSPTGALESVFTPYGRQAPQAVDFPYERGESFSLHIPLYAVNVWIIGPEEILFQPCTEAEQDARNQAEPWNFVDCREDVRYGDVYLTGVVNANGSITGDVLLYDAFGVFDSTSFIATPVRARRGLGT